MFGLILGGVAAIATVKYDPRVASYVSPLREITVFTPAVAPVKHIVRSCIKPQPIKPKLAKPLVITPAAKWRDAGPDPKPDLFRLGLLRNNGDSNYGCWSALMPTKDPHVALIDAHEELHQIKQTVKLVIARVKEMAVAGRSLTEEDKLMVKAIQAEAIDATRRVQDRLFEEIKDAWPHNSFANL
jgi:hypothetical protein